MTLSIIIPVYNTEKYLKNCIDSIVDNSPDNFEIILIDDGSTDGSPALVDLYADKYSFVRGIHKQNGGLASARNAGLEIARGEYVTFIDSDDYVENGYVNYCLKWIKDLADWDILAFSHYIDYAETGNNKLYHLPDLVKTDAKNGLRNLEKADAFYFAWNKIYKKSAIDAFPKTKFKINSEPCEDIMFNLELFKKINAVTLVSVPMYHWIRRGEDTLANRYRQNLIERNFSCIALRNDLYKYLNMQGTDRDLLANGNARYVFACIPNMYRTANYFSKQERMDFYRRIIGSEDVRRWLDDMSLPDTLIRQFRFIYKFKSPKLIDDYYFILMSFRNKFDKIWKTIRKHTYPNTKRGLNGIKLSEGIGLPHLIINADDYGLNEHNSFAIAEAFKKELVTDTTMIANGDYFGCAVELSRKGQFDNKIGIHFNLTEGRPLTEDIKAFPTFVSDGMFHGRINRLRTLTKEEKCAVYKELSAQIERIENAGIRVTHADSHNHIHTAIFIAPVVFKVCKEHGIGKIRLHRNIGHISLFKRVVKKVYNHVLHKKGFITTKLFGSMEDIEHTLPQDCTEIMVHPDFDRQGNLIDRVDEEAAGYPIGKKMSKISGATLTNYGDLK